MCTGPWVCREEWAAVFDPAPWVAIAWCSLGQHWEHNDLSRAGPSDRKGNRPFSYFPLTKTKDCSQGLTLFPKLCFSMDNCHSPACTDSIKVFLGNPPKDSAQWTTQLFIHCLGMISLNKRDWFCFSLFCDMDLTLLSTTRMRLAFFILLAAKFYSLGFVCALNGQDSWCSAWRREYSRGSLKHPCNTWMGPTMELERVFLWRYAVREQGGGWL